MACPPSPLLYLKSGDTPAGANQKRQARVRVLPPGASARAEYLQTCAAAAFILPARRSCPHPRLHARPQSPADSAGHRNARTSCTAPLHLHWICTHG